jgi:pilus assembly protein Flp/PilA
MFVENENLSIKGEVEMINRFMKFFKEEEGATAVEYGIMVAAIAAVIIGIVIAVGSSTKNAFDQVNSQMPLNTGS